MKKLKIHLENCYGIKKLQATFDFSNSNAYAIYAPNGVMKSSFAATFKDVADGKESRDRVFPERVTVRTITDEDGAPLPRESVLVLPPYDEVFGAAEKISTLLVDQKLRKEYEDLLLTIEQAKEPFLRALKKQSGSRRDLAKEVSLTFTRSGTSFRRALGRVKEELLTQKEAPYTDVPYDLVFDEKALAFLETKDFRTAIESYITKYNELLSSSKFFRQGTFNYYNASMIAKSLADNGFFDAQHTVTLNSEQKIEVANVAQLEQIIDDEKRGISNDPELRKKFAEIEKQLNKNVNLREFQEYFVANPELLPRLAEVAIFREDVWKSYFKANIELYHQLLANYDAAERRQAEIEEEARQQQTQWEAVIAMFNSRFFVPFTLTASNRVSVILGAEPILTLGFTFRDGDDAVDVDKEAILEVLSTGEKKALYILNVLFEVEARKKANQETVFVIDDIADSFDYKNKYAIIQYLKDIAEEAGFREILLTHNFDFFRTVESRFVRYSNCMMVSKTSAGLVLEQAQGIRNVFINDWKARFHSDSKIRIASIPFVRNLLEYTKGENDPGYIMLTSLLHWKPDSGAITQEMLCNTFNELFGTAASCADSNRAVLAVLDEEAERCLHAGAGMNFENKIVLSIAIRIAAERFMVEAIDDSVFVSAIDVNQTTKLLSRYMRDFAAEQVAIAVLQRVALMTPENIHLNSFMYEPILDMSDDHLRKLYIDVLTLSEPNGRDEEPSVQAPKARPRRK